MTLPPEETKTVAAPTVFDEGEMQGLPLPEDPLADGILMAHQKAWLEDTYDLKLCEKGRRTGLTFAEALDDTITSATSRADGGDNVFYIGDTKDKGREFIGYVAHFARVLMDELLDIEEFLFEDQLKDGSTRNIAAFRVRFASGFRVEALSSRPANIRGLQGIVVIDEAAFHKDVREVLDAVNALLIWGGKVRVISTHNGERNPFNELINEARAGKNDFHVHTITFDDAVNNGLYERRCFVKGEEPTAEGKDAWLKLIRGSYGTRTAAMRQELDVIPAEGDGVFMTRALIEACAHDDIPVLRWVVPDELKFAAERERDAAVERWFNGHAAPLLAALDPHLRSGFGQDFARKGDASAIWPFQIARDLTRQTPFVIELRNCPFEMQKKLLFMVVDRLPRFFSGVLDATGNGAYLAEVAAQRYGSRVVEQSLSLEWYRINMPQYRTAFEDRSITIPKDEDVVGDHQAIVYQDGVARVPQGATNTGTDGYERHGDTAIAGALAWFASRQDSVPIEFQSSGDGRVAEAAMPGRSGIDRDTGFGVARGGADLTGY
ncbi:hypothetical protein [Pyruvatibacter sp.]|uniref:hypothetical protein n=1 Tax=Pyruvatibacter sp. TaxID=1981328 RepID=UPI0032F09C1E